MPALPVTLDHLRRHAVARSLFTPTSLPKALARLGFVQADPIRAPARAQDLTLRHRVRHYRAGDLERRYAALGIEEDFFVNYGFLGRDHRALMHPRSAARVWPAQRHAQAQAVLGFMQGRAAVHPREVEAAFAHGKAKNWFGGTSNASTQLLDEMHYRSLLRVVRRDSGTRVYACCDLAPVPDPLVARARLDALVDLAVQVYAPLPAASLGRLLSHLGAAAPQWRADRAGALARAKARLAQARVAGIDWFWPVDEDPRGARRTARVAPDEVRLLTPFDPVVWDRLRFELFWGWAYRFEAYTPAAQRRLGYYALPLLWGEQVIGWGNVAVRDGVLRADLGYVSGTAPREAGFKAGLAAELDRLRVFLGLAPEGAA